MIDIRLYDGVTQLDKSVEGIKSKADEKEKQCDLCETRQRREKMKRAIDFLSLPFSQRSLRNLP